MIDALHLLWIVPLAFQLGFGLCAMIVYKDNQYD